MSYIWLLNEWGFLFSEIKYSWVFNGQRGFLRQDARRFISQRTGNLYIAKVEASDAGNYTCAVRNMMTNATVFSSPTPVEVRRDGKRASSVHLCCSWLCRTLNWHTLLGAWHAWETRFCALLTHLRHAESCTWETTSVCMKAHIHMSTNVVRGDINACRHQHSKGLVTHNKPNHDCYCAALQIWVEAEM